MTDTLAATNSPASAAVRPEGTDEVLVVESLGERIRVLALVADHYEDSITSTVLAVAASDLKAAIRWPH